MIDTESKLDDFLVCLRDAKWIALDTEADSLHAYPEKLCLIQLSWEGTDKLIDPLSRVKFAKLFAELSRHELIFHGADYDLRLLHRHCDFVPKSIFDTMIASRLLGQSQFGLDSLVSKYLGVKLEKGPQKANWARRPLTPRMEQYARNDTHFLKPLADILKQDLKEKGRLEWHRECCARLINDCAQPRAVDPDEQWRVKGSSKLPPASLAVLREIWRWRELEAVAANKPPYFILQPETMVKFADAAPKALPAEQFFPKHFSNRRRQGVLEAVHRGLEVKNPPHPRKSRGRRQTESEKKRLRELERRRNRHAEDLGIDSSLIASRATLLLLAQDWDQHQPGLMNWQRQLLAS